MADSHKDVLYQVWLFHTFVSILTLCVSCVEIYVINALDSCKNMDSLLIILETLHGGAHTFLKNGLNGEFSLCILVCDCTAGGDVFIMYEVCSFMFVN